MPPSALQLRLILKLQYITICPLPAGSALYYQWPNGRQSQPLIMSLYSILNAQHKELGRKLEEANRLNNEHIEKCKQILSKLKELEYIKE